jgi:hypothetical protein
VRESGSRQALSVRDDSFRNQNVLKCGPLATDFKLAIVVSSFVLVVQIDK